MSGSDDIERYLDAVAFAADAVDGHATAVAQGREDDPYGDLVDRWEQHYASRCGVNPQDIRAARKT